MSKILERIVKKSGVPNILEILTKLTGSDIQSLLIKVFSKRVSLLNPKDILTQNSSNRFVQPCVVSQRKLINFDCLAYSVLPDDFTSIELSSVSPVGVNSILSKVNQNNVIATIRNTEVVADTTTALSVICAKERKKLLQKDKKDLSKIKLATSHRSIRSQDFKNIEGFTPHFRTFALTTAGKNSGSETFEKESFFEHISFYLNLFDYLNKQKFCKTTGVMVLISNILITEKLIENFNLNRGLLRKATQTKDSSLFEECYYEFPSLVKSVVKMDETLINSLGITNQINLLALFETSVIKKLRETYPKIIFLFDLKRVSGIGYYEDLCFKIIAKNPNKERYPLVDGGLTDWTKKLTTSNKERLFVSGVGSELLCKFF